MAKLKRLVNIHDEIVKINLPISDEELKARKIDYQVETPEKFAKKYRQCWHAPVKIVFNGREHQIQLNRCVDPFCKNFGLPQLRFTEIKNKPSRYRLGSRELKDKISKDIICNPDPTNEFGFATSSAAIVISNWSVAGEISRLAKNDKVMDIEPDYCFHRDGCKNQNLTPFRHHHFFYSRGKNPANSHRWQCKECFKITNVLPTRNQASRYHQKRNDIILPFALALLNKTPVNRTCEMLGIGKPTYYSKLEWLYKCCLEFLAKHETKPLQSKHFKNLWLNTDQLIYYLNPQRRKGRGPIEAEDESYVYQTRVIVSGEMFSRYVFRSDLAFDWEVDLERVEEDTILYKEDHLYEFARKNARLKASYIPQSPSPNDSQTTSEYHKELKMIRNANQGLSGLHVNSTYTAIAHYWLLKELIGAQNWRFVTDQDNSLMTALFRVFAKEVALGDAHHFLCKVPKERSKRQCLAEYQQSLKDLKTWSLYNDLGHLSTIELALKKLEEDLQTHSFHKMVESNGQMYPVWANNPILHPLPSADEGKRWVDCTTPVYTYTPVEVASMLLKVNHYVTDLFNQTLRRRISFLERPLTTARGAGRSYIYANTNPKYAQYAITVLRTYYNFCLPITFREDQITTPAQRLGLVDRCYSLKDIIYS